MFNILSDCVSWIKKLDSYGLLYNVSMNKNVLKHQTSSGLKIKHILICVLKVNERLVGLG